jgi:O-antigen ligase
MSQPTLSSTLRMPEKAALLLRALVLLGYPLIALLVTFLGLGAESGMISNPYRVAVLCLALYVLYSHMGTSLGGRLAGPLVIFFALYTARLLYDWWVTDIIGASTALLYFSMLVLVPCLASMVAGTNTESDKQFAKLLLVLGIVFSIGTLTAQLVGFAHNPWADQGSEYNRLAFEALNPISIGHAGAITLIAAFYLLVETRLTYYWRLALWTGLVLGGSVLVVSNSRGPIVALAIAIAGFFLLRLRRLSYVMPLLILAPLVISTDNEFIANIIDRFVEQDPFAVNLSNQDRQTSQEAAIESFLRHPIFGQHDIDPSLGAGSYPHNIIIETAMALGLVGLSVLGAMLAKAWAQVLRFYNRSHPLLVILFIQQFVAMQLSGALYGADAFFMLLGLALTARNVANQSAVAVQPQFRRQSM